MKCPLGPQSPEQWIDFLEGAATPAEIAGVKSHIEQCAVCTGVHERLTAARITLTASAATSSIHTGFAARLWDSLRFRIRRSRQVRMDGPYLDLDQLRSILSSMCGEAAAEDALQKASGDGRLFARNLGSMVEVMCGTQAARFVEQAAHAAHRERVA
jgi:hypothetical protein